MKLALFSDIHANIQALQACMEHARSQGATQLAFLGDLVGYGGSPAAVLANQCVPMEEWTYDRGPGTFLGVVRIYNGAIESVRDGDRSR